MRVRPIIFLGVASLLLCLAAQGSAGAFSISESPGGSFRLTASNGYAAVLFASADEAGDKGQVTVSVRNKNRSASYTAPAMVSADAIEADLGSLGRIDLNLHRSGGQKSGRLPCGGQRVTYEPATYTGTIEFEGEGGYTRTDQSAVRSTPLLFFGFGLGCDGSGSGEEVNSDRLPGARLRGSSFAHGRVPSFRSTRTGPAQRWSTPPRCANGSAESRSTGQGGGPSRRAPSPSPTICVPRR